MGQCQVTPPCTTPSEGGAGSYGGVTGKVDSGCGSGGGVAAATSVSSRSVVTSGSVDGGTGIVGSAGTGSAAAGPETTGPATGASAGPGSLGVGEAATVDGDSRTTRPPPSGTACTTTPLAVTV